MFHKIMIMIGTAGFFELKYESLVPDDGMDESSANNRDGSREISYTYHLYTLSHNLKHLLFYIMFRNWYVKCQYKQIEQYKQINGQIIIQNFDSKSLRGNPKVGQVLDDFI